MSDGAAAVVVTTRGEAARRGLPVLGVLRSFAVVGCPPDIMGIGPAVAIPEALKKAGKYCCRHRQVLKMLVNTALGSFETLQKAGIAEIPHRL